MIMDYYQKNPSAISSLRGALYEEKILKLIKSKINLTKKSVSLKEAEEILKSYTKKTGIQNKQDNTKKNQKKAKIKKKK